jgi:hypothetical protein
LKFPLRPRRFSRIIRARTKEELVMRIVIATFLLSLIAVPAFAGWAPPTPPQPYTHCFATPNGSYVCE